jgi:hypothetical protein
MVAIAAGAMMTAVIARDLNKSDYSSWLVLSNPAKAPSLITENHLAILIDCISVPMMIKCVGVKSTLHCLCYLLIDGI